ncbi:MAG TPA: hypothetical protein VFL93_00095, partial [Longimicrobiaceae bacterium]|nr:hypothetical protein [Longimicrobiaceae bacterium]
MTPFRAHPLVAALAVGIGILLAPKTGTAQSASPGRENPFFQASTLPFQAPPFDRIRDSDYEPA